MKNKKADFKIQETAFMLIALILFFVLIFIFYSNFQLSKMYSERNQLLQERAITMLSKLQNMPELSTGNGLDYDKIVAFRNLTKYDSLFSGILKIQVLKLYPEKETITIIDNIKGKDYISYSAYVPICQTEFQYEEAFEKCEIAKLIVFVEQVSKK